jgi:hypothetical protein
MTRSAKAGYVRIDTGPIKDLRRQLKVAQTARVKVGVLGEKSARTDVTEEGREFMRTLGTKKTTSRQRWRAALRKFGHKASGLSNADIGAIHEFGYKEGNIPERSWLRAPVMLYLPPTLERRGKQLWRIVISKRGVVAALKLLGVTAEKVIHEAFETGGFGKWPDLKKATIKRKGSSAVLIDTAQLRQSVRSAVVKGGGE